MDSLTNIWIQMHWINKINMALTVGGNAVKASGENSAVSVPAENLEADKDYRIGVSAYREVPYFAESAGAGSTENPETGTSAGEETGAAEGAEGSTAGSGGTSAPKALTAKYYSPEAMSNDEILPQYTPLNMTLTVNDTAIDADENGVYHAYVGKNPGTLTVTADGANSITVTGQTLVKCCYSVIFSHFLSSFHHPASPSSLII